MVELCPAAQDSIYLLQLVVFVTQHMPMRNGKQVLHLKYHTGMHPPFFSLFPSESCPISLSFLTISEYITADAFIARQPRRLQCRMGLDE